MSVRKLVRATFFGSLAMAILFTAIIVLVTLNENLGHLAFPALIYSVILFTGYLLDPEN